ncbi:alpha-amylase domain-containing protein [Pedobacter sp. SYSU D00535]|uniref:alpha-amylase domain-containing protein n=1 Tax=Pedobacter sp. SYSU D00535 TaxID=2810308 RepID=UPI001A95C6D7|nr:alpha-amylase domain-containing protein [Pedobacter sp. SYSU D00535]
MSAVTKLANSTFYCLIVAVLGLFHSGCSKDGSSDTEQFVSSAEAVRPDAQILMQTFYWDVKPEGTWWDTISSKLDSWKSSGVTALWLPVVSKGQSGIHSMGYDPYDYFDFGQYDQHGSIETRFGSFAELKSLIVRAKARNFKLIADIVLNHNSGGDLEYSPYSKKSYWTRFSPRSGKFFRSFEDFHPNALHANDEGVFAEFPDLCHHTENVKDWLYNRPDGIGKYYRDSLQFDGWRFDYVKGFSPSVVKSWNAAVGGISIGEYWDGDVNLVNNWCKAANSAAFDFPLMYAMKAAFDGLNLAELQSKGLIAANPAQAYTFVANHDVDEISVASKPLAYAYIMVAEGTPCIFYKDFEAGLDKVKLNQLIWVKKNLAAGSTKTLLSSQYEYILRRNGTPGVIAYFNINNSDVSRRVQSNWANTLLKDYTGANADVSTDASGMATITCKGKSYAVYAPKELN